MDRIKINIVLLLFFSTNFILTVAFVPNIQHNGEVLVPVNRFQSNCWNLSTCSQSLAKGGKLRARPIMMAAVSQQEAQKGIDKVVQALRKDNQAKQELGNLVKVNNVLGYGSPRKGIMAVRFNASFQKGGKGMSSIPLPFGLGQSKVKEGRGTMVGQVKASINIETGKVMDCSVFRDLGYGRAFNLKV